MQTFVIPMLAIQAWIGGKDKAEQQIKHISDVNVLAVDSVEHVLLHTIWWFNIDMENILYK